MPTGVPITPEDIQEMLKKAKVIIPEQHLHFKEDLWVELGICKQTAVEYGLSDNPEIIKLLDNEKLIIKRNLRKKWYLNPNPTLQICLYKLLASQTEQESLAFSRSDTNLKVESPSSEFVLFKLNNATTNQNIGTAPCSTASVSTSCSQ